jgi:hypothetical protein
MVVISAAQLLCFVARSRHFLPVAAMQRLKFCEIDLVAAQSGCGYTDSSPTNLFLQTGRLAGMSQRELYIGGISVGYSAVFAVQYPTNFIVNRQAVWAQLVTF